MSQINVNVVAPLGYTGLQVGNNDYVAIIDSGGTEVFKSTPDNILIGENSLNSITVGTSNISIGQDSLNSLTGGFNNISIGKLAGYSLQTHPTNPALSGSGNIFLGSLSGHNVIYGSGNIIIGGSSTASYMLQGGSNNILLGVTAIPSTNEVDNEITLGNYQHTVLRCAVTTITSLSDARDKKDITDLRAGLDFVKGLRPVEFVWDERNEEGRHDIADFGFIAQDLKAAQEDAQMADILKLVYESNPEKLEASYGKLLPILVKAVQELAAKVEQLESK